MENNREERIDSLIQELEALRNETTSENQEAENENLDIELGERRPARSRRIESREGEITISKNTLKNFAIGVLLIGAGYAAATGIGGCETFKKNAQLPTESALEENSNEQAPTQEIIDEVEVTVTENAETTPEAQTAELTGVEAIKAEIQAERSEKFSQLVLSTTHYPDSVEGQAGERYWDKNVEAGLITVTRPYGEMSEKNPHNERVEMLFYPNQEQVIEEWNVLEIPTNLPSGAFWLQSDSTGGKVNVEFFDGQGNVIRQHRGEIVVVEWDGKEVFQFRDEITGETRPAAFQLFEVGFNEQHEASTVNVPYEYAKVTMEPATGSYLRFATGHTMHFGEGGDAGFGMEK